MKIDATYSPAAPSAGEAKRQDNGPVASEQQQSVGNTPDTESTDRAELEKAVNKLNKTAEIYSHDVKFTVHEQTHRIMVQVLKKNTEEVITEMPPRRILDMVAQFQEMVGLLIDKKV